MSLFFAYDDLMASDMMRSICPNAVFVDVSSVDGYGLSFRSKTGPGRLTLDEEFPAKTSGVVWSIPTDEKQQLYDFLSEQASYSERQCQFEVEGQRFQGFTFVLAGTTHLSAPDRAYRDSIIDCGFNYYIDPETVLVADNKAQLEAERTAASRRKEDYRGSLFDNVDWGKLSVQPVYEKMIEHYLSSDIFSLYMYGSDSKVSKAAYFLRLLYYERCDAVGKIPNIKIVSVNDYLQDAINKIRYHDRASEMEAREYRECEILILTGLHKATGKEMLQENLYELIDYHERMRTHKVIVTSPVPIRDLQGIEDRICSQLQGGLVCGTEDVI